MGPVTLFDKSFLHSLSLNEAVWFDHFTLAVVCPIFYVETCSDLKKEGLTEKQAKHLVGVLAAKAPQVSGTPNVFHRDMCITNLVGNEIEMSGRVSVRGGRAVSNGESSGYVFENFPELLAFERWKEGQFEEIEKVVATNWRGSVASLTVDFIDGCLNDLEVDLSSCNSLDAAYQIAHATVLDRAKAFKLILFLVKALNINDFILVQEIQKTLLDNAKVGREPIGAYASFYAKLELFYFIAIKKRFMSLNHRADILYLAYLPFCYVFVSTDRSHKMSVKYFLRDDQIFINGAELKADLNKLDQHYKTTIPDEEKIKGMMSFASFPPQTGDFLVTKMWDKVIGQKWRLGDPPRMSPEKEKELIDELDKKTNSETLPEDEIDFDLDSADFLTLKRTVSVKRGDWFQLPHDINKKGL